MPPLDGLPLVSVVVLNWNGRRFVDGLFDSLARQTYPAAKTEIIFVDNGSTDDSVDYFARRQPSNARVIRSAVNRGYAGGNNLGLHQTLGDFVAVCNNDLELAPTCLETLVRTAQSTGADVVVPKLVYADTGLINNAGSELLPHSAWPNHERGMNAPTDAAEFNVEVPVTGFCGASPLIARSFFREVGLFDRHFFLYWEDVDLSWRGQKQGKQYVYAPDAVAYHHASGSTGGEQSPLFIHYVSRNRILVLLKHGAPRAIAAAVRDVAGAHVLTRAYELCVAIRRRRGLGEAARGLWQGARIFLGVLALAPFMLAKRWGLLDEERV